MSIRHDRELADTLEDEIARRVRRRGANASVEGLRREARALRAKIVQAERQQKGRP